MFEFHHGGFHYCVVHFDAVDAPPDSTKGAVGTFVVRDHVMESTLRATIAYE